MTSVDNTPETTPRDLRTVSVRSPGKSGSQPMSTHLTTSTRQCVTPDDLDSGRHRDLHYRTPDDLDTARNRELHSRTFDDVDAVIRREINARTPDDLDSEIQRQLHLRTPDDLDYVTGKNPKSRTPDDLDSVRRRVVNSRTPDDLDSVRRRDMNSRTPDDLDSVRHRDVKSRTPDDLDTVRRRDVKSRTPDDLDTVRRRDMKSRTPDDLDSVRHRDMKSWTPDDLDTVRRRDVKSRTPDDLDTVRRRDMKSRTPDDLDSVRRRDMNSRTPDELDAVRRRDMKSRTPDDLDSIRPRDMNSRTPDDLDSARGRDRLCVTESSVKHMSRRSVTPDDLDSDYSYRVGSKHRGSKHKYVESEASDMQRTKSLSSVLHSSIASWELANRAILQPQGERARGSDGLYFQSGVDPPPRDTNGYHTNTHATDKMTSHEQGHSLGREHPSGISTATNVVGTLHGSDTRGYAPSRDNYLTEKKNLVGKSTTLSRKSPVSGSTYRYTSLRKTTNLTQSAGALSLRSKSVSHLDDANTHLSSKTLFRNLDEKPRRYNPPAERLHSVNRHGDAVTSVTLSASPDLVRHTTLATTAGQSDRHTTIRHVRHANATGDYQRHSFLPVEGTAQPSRHDTLLCHPTAVSSRHCSGDASDASDRAFKPTTGRHTQVPAAPPVKLYHIDNV